jgi:hypothetical protein
MSRLQKEIRKADQNEDNMITLPEFRLLFARLEPSLPPEKVLKFF